MLFSKPLDLLSIGDTATDAFIHISQAEILDGLDHVTKELCVTFGGKIPYDFVKVVSATGNSANAAVSAARLGLNVGFVSNLGADQYGEEMLATLKRERVQSRFVTAHKGMLSNYHYVLWYDVERTILVKHNPYPYNFAAAAKALRGRRAPRYIYLSSLGSNSLPYHHEIAVYLAANPQVKLVFQPGTFQIKFGAPALAEIYKRTEALFCNREEASAILGKSLLPATATPEERQNEFRELCQSLAALGPKIICITNGIFGAYAYDTRAATASNPGEFWFMPVYPQEPYERTGAGDAFSSAVTSALVLGKPLSEALAWGPINSMSVVQKIGAQEGLLTREKLLDYLKKAPVNYTINKL
jgi:ribokinase